MAKFKLNKVVRPFTLYEFDTFDSQMIFGDHGFTIEAVVDSAFSANPLQLKVDDCANNKEYFYVFEGGFDKYGVTEEGWYTPKRDTNGEYVYNDAGNYIYELISDDIILVTPLHTSQPEDWDADVYGEWYPYFATDYFYTLVTRVYESVPEYLTAIADIVREATNTTDKIKGSELPSKINESLSGPKVHIVEELPTIEEAQLFDIYLIGNVDQKRNYFHGEVYIVMSNYDTIDLQFIRIYDNRPS